MHAALSRAVAAALLGPCFAPDAFAQEQFEVQGTLRHYFPSSIKLAAMAMGDVDGDGDPDIITGGPERLLLNDGRGRFTDASAERMPATAHPTRALALGDVDGDGDLDVVIGANGQNRLYLNDGSGGFTDATAGHLPEQSEPTAAVALADLDGDGDLDLVVGNGVDGGGSPVANRLYANDGTGTFTDVTAERLPVDADDTDAVTAEDTDRDGDLDLVFGNQGQNRAYMNDGSGRFTDETAARMPVDADDTLSLSPGDVDGDGDLDIAIGNRHDDRLYLNDGSGVFTDVSATHIPARVYQTRALELVDVDGDGDLDLVLGAAQDGLFVNDGQGIFRDVTAERLSQSAGETHGLAIGDVDGDADADVVFGSGPGYGEASRLFLNDGAGEFLSTTPVCWPSLGWEHRAVALADVDGDEDLDALFGTHILGGQNLLYLNDGRGCFTDATATRLPVAADDTRALAVGDVDRDGDLDLVVGNGRGGYWPGGRQNKLLLNDGSGTFSDVTGSRLPAAADPTLALALGDLDRDGDLDLVVGNGVYGAYVSTGAPNALYLNDGRGAFADATVGRLPPASRVTLALALGDVDGDGDLDLAIGDAEEGFGLQPAQDSLYLNDGNAHFTDVTAARMPAIETETYALAFGDVDADGDRDLVIGTRGQDRLYLNDGLGTFVDATAKRMPLRSTHARALALADVDDDGDLDIVTAHDALYLNDGHGSFRDTSSRIPITSATTLALALGDVDGDGDADLVRGAFGRSLLVRNLHRQLSTPVYAKLSLSYDLEFHAKPGYATSSHTAVALLGAGLWPAPIVLPPFGTSYVVPLFVLPAVSISRATGMGVLRLRIPPAPTLIGVPLYTQGVIVNDAVPGEVRFTGYAVDPILR